MRMFCGCGCARFESKNLLHKKKNLSGIYEKMKNYVKQTKANFLKILSLKGRQDIKDLRKDFFKSPLDAL